MNEEVSAKLSEGGRIVVPHDFRKKLGLQIGDEVILRLEGEEIRIYSKTQAVRYAQQRLSQYMPKNRSLSGELIAERRSETYE